MATSLSSVNEAPKSSHIFMVSFPGQGHINPLLRLARRLAHSGLFISFCAPESAGAIIRKTNTITDDVPTNCGRGTIRFEFFDDGTGDPYNLEAFMARLELVGREKLPQMIRKQEELGRPVSCVVNNPFIPWVCDVSDSLGIPCAMLWVQSCACFAAYYHYYHNLVPFPTEEAVDIRVEIPCLPVLEHDEFPSFLHPNSPYRVLSKAILGQFGNLSKTFCVLMDTFQELELETIEYMSKICRPIMTVGPLFKELGCASALRADFHVAERCTEWLDSKPGCSVVYVSFGSVVDLKQEQVDEIAHGLLESGVSFLWVLRPPHSLPEGFVDEVGERGRVVRWSPQEEVLAHPATACFLTHCGWNSTVEAMASGVPVVAFPQWGDQVTNAKFMVDVYKVGVRLCRGDAEGRIVTRDEVVRGLKAAISGPQAAEFREIAVKWKKSAEAAVAEGGSSSKNIQDFVDQVVRPRSLLD
ncbi:limonoid glucosyltransferase [Salvia divinorum]|uniref:Glycosyltransferase n=1 Tax=Salvia divinorum TaxID=28513 RepID=A0ABD1I6Z6_SALDI